MIVKARKKGQIVWTISNLMQHEYDYISIACGAFDPFIVIFWLMGKRCLRVWTGTDVLKCLKFWDYRIRAKFQSLFCDNITETKWLTEELKSVGINGKTVEHSCLLSSERSKTN